MHEHLPRDDIGDIVALLTEPLTTLEVKDEREDNLRSTWQIIAELRPWPEEILGFEPPVSRREECCTGLLEGPPAQAGTDVMSRACQGSLMRHTWA